MSQHDIVKLLEKTSHYDKDERYMATSDIINLLKKESKMDSTLESRLCTAVLKQLNDTSADVQAVAIKCIGELTGRVQESQLKEVCASLSDHLLGDKDELKDIYSIGLKTTVSGVPEHMGSTVALELTPKMIRGIQIGDDTVKGECLEVARDLIVRFGHEMEKFHEMLKSLIFVQLSAKNESISKRATSCIGSLAVVISDVLLNKLMDELLACIKKPRPEQDVRVLIQTIGMISRSVGFRLGTHLPAVVPLFLNNLGTPTDEMEHEDQGEELDDLRENILHAFESFAMKCPQETAAFEQELVKVCLVYMQYDPNYNYDADSDEEEEEYSDDEYSDGEYSDDDDSSWKVRRAAVKVLRAFMVSRPEFLGTFYDQCAEPLVERFKEREDSVKLDVISCIEDMLKATINLRMMRGEADEEESDRPRKLHRQNSIDVRMQNMQEDIMKRAIKLLADRKASVKVKIGIFCMLQQWALATGHSIEEDFGNLVPKIVTALKDRNGNLKLSALVFLRIVAEQIRSSEVQKHMSVLVSAVAACVEEDWYKIIAEALRVLAGFARSIRPMDENGDFVEGSAGDPGRFAPIIFEAVLSRFIKNDIDQEIKECSILAMGDLIAHVGDSIDGIMEKSNVFGVLLDRLKNEVTRMPALKMLKRIADTPLSVAINFHNFLEPVTIELSGFLRQQLRTLKHASLTALDALVLSKGSDLSPALCEVVLNETAALISDSDLNLTHLALRISTNLLKANALANCPIVSRLCSGKAIDLAASPLLQGLALRSLLVFFAELVAVEWEETSYEELSSRLIEPLLKCDDFPRQCLQNVAQCIATLAMNSQNKETRTKAVDHFAKNIRGGTDANSKIALQIALYSIGEIGHQTDLSIHEDLYATISSVLADNVEQIRSAAAFALGSIAVGNMNAFLPALLDGLRNDRSKHYQFLISLREVILRHDVDGLEFSPHKDLIFSVLFENSRDEEENIRSIVAECLGKVASMSNDSSELVEMTKDKDPFSRWTAATAIRFCPLTLNAEEIPFAALIDDENLAIRQTILMTLNSVVHHNSGILRKHIEGILGPVYKHMYQNDALKRTVDLGPFKQKIDDGLPIRKAAFTLMGSVLNTLLEKVDLGPFMDPLKSGLGDKQTDVQMLCHQIVVRMCTSVPSAVIGGFDDYMKDALTKTIKKKMKEGEVGTTKERGNDVIRSALRVVDNISLIPEMLVKHATFKQFVEDTCKNHSEKVKTMYFMIQSDRGRNAGSRSSAANAKK